MVGGISDGLDSGTAVVGVLVGMDIGVLVLTSVIDGDGRRVGTPRVVVGCTALEGTQPATAEEKTRNRKPKNTPAMCWKFVASSAGFLNII